MCSEITYIHEEGIVVLHHQCSHRILNILNLVTNLNDVVLSPFKLFTLLYPECKGARAPESGGPKQTRFCYMLLTKSNRDEWW